ncbi:MAG: discoidin domain-containing protein, partial [Actinobacteria bacterium]|nr:discoidin domain-containing protein [Actinomycetota bacterium]
MRWIVVTAAWLVSSLIVVSTICGVALAQENLARTGTAVQSSDWGGGQFPASVAIDGDFGNFTATATDDDMATWEVDLGAPAEIDRIVVHNRGDGCCQSRLRDITISVREFSFAEDPFGDEDPVFESELLNEENEDGGDVTRGPPNLAVELEEPVTGQYVRVTRLSDPDLSGTGGVGNADEANVLSIGEVEVFGTLLPECPTEGAAEHGDTHCRGITIDAPLDGGPGLYLVTGSGADDTGDAVIYTFTAESEAGHSIVRGPDRIDFAELNLSAGSWTLSVTVDDSLICDDAAADSTCTEVLEVEGFGQGSNVALSGVASQSSDYAPQFGAGRANDGDLGNFTATATNDDMPS